MSVLAGVSLSKLLGLLGEKRFVVLSAADNIPALNWKTKAIGTHLLSS